MIWKESDDMFSVFLNSIGKARGALGEASATLKKNSRVLREISSEGKGNYALDKCNNSMEVLADRLAEYHRESRELSECLQDIIDCYREMEENILEMGFQTNDSFSKVEFGMYDYNTVSSAMESMDIKFVTI
ncbi:MAG: hypothetical protein E7263_04285 [Lachnospiraceae bacterium]|nr:hypothetical protein [Lachnospiraceae bacterium]